MRTSDIEREEMLKRIAALRSFQNWKRKRPVRIKIMFLLEFLVVRLQ